MFCSAHSVKSSKMPHSQTIRDYKKLQIRMKENDGKYQYISTFLDKYFGTHVNTMILNSLAKIITDVHGVPLDRLAKRNRSAMLCWYAENWDKICPVLSQLKLSFGKSQTFFGETKLLNLEDYRHLSWNPLAPNDPYSVAHLLNFD